MNECRFRFGIVCLLAGMGFVFTPVPAIASLISSADLFLAPSSVPEGSYAFHELSGLDGSSGLTQTYTSSDMGGATITGVQILPLLVANAGTVQGNYSAADLAAINSGNFSQYFFVQPNQDYYADLTAGVLSVEYYAAGTYFVKVTAEQNGVTFSSIFEDDVADSLGGLPGQPRDRTLPGRVIATPTADLSIVSNPASEPAGTNGINGIGYSGAGFLTLQQAGQNPQLANSVQSVINQIQAACQAKGGPISVTLVGHGASGAVQIGNTRITNTPRANSNDVTPAQFQAAIDTIAQGPNAGAQCVNKIAFYSCNVNTNTPGKTQGSDFMNVMQASIPDTQAFNQYTTASAPYTVFNRRTGQVVVSRTGFFDVGAGGVLGGIEDLVQEIPEPSGILLIVTSLGILIALRVTDKFIARSAKLMMA